jgi:flagellar M-ring protein FliF
MNPNLAQLLEQLRSTSTQVRLLVGVGAVVLIALVIGVVAWARRPHYELLVSGLDASESARVQAALSGAGLRWDVSQPPGPFVVYVDRSDRHRALAAIASAGALEKLPGGILGSDGGVSSVFLSAGERQQMVRKREWQEMERLLEQLDFVRAARVRTSVPENRGLGRAQPMSGSVTLTLTPGRSLGRDQAQTVANLVRFGLGIDSEHLIVADQAGVSVFDGSELAGGNKGEWLDHKERHDKRVQQEVNQMLERILGPDLAHVTIASEWDFDRSTVIAETTDPEKRAIVSETQSETEGKNQTASAVGGAAGSSSVMQVPGDGFGVDNVGVVSGLDGAQRGVGSSTTRDTRREYVAPRITTQTVRTAPVLVRLSVGLTLDKSLEPQRAQLEELVKAAVGFDPERRSDQFRSALVEWRQETVATGPTGEPIDPDAPAVSPWLEIGLTRGVEIVAALAFVILLFSALRRSKVTPTAVATDPDAAAVDERGNRIDPEVLALAQVQELLAKDPDRVIAILTNWAREEHGAAHS